LCTTRIKGRHVNDVCLHYKAFQFTFLESMGLRS
jgi:hypothetical protein